MTPATDPAKKPPKKKATPATSYFPMLRQALTRRRKGQAWVCPLHGRACVMGTRLTATEVEVLALAVKDFQRILDQHEEPPLEETVVRTIGTPELETGT